MIMISNLKHKKTFILFAIKFRIENNERGQLS